MYIFYFTHVFHQIFYCLLKKDVTFFAKYKGNKKKLFYKKRENLMYMKIDKKYENGYKYIKSIKIGVD